MSLYAEQQSLALCQAKLDSVNQNLQSNTAQRLNREAEMTNIRKLYKKVASDGDETRQQGSSAPVFYSSYTNQLAMSFVKCINATRKKKLAQNLEPYQNHAADGMFHCPQLHVRNQVINR